MSEPTENTEHWTIGRLLDWTRSYFEKADLDQPRLCAEILLAHALRCEKIRLYTRYTEVPDESALSAFRNLVSRAARHEPIAYLTGHREFFSLDFDVTPDVLIPRPETETLVEVVIESLRADGVPAAEILEIGTGSGCIAVTLAKHLPNARIKAVDISAEALDVAQANARKHEVADRIQFRQTDANAPAGLAVTDTVSNGRLHLICSNPPYVAETERDELPPEIRDYEPSIALYAGSDGLDFYRRLAGHIAEQLAPGGSLCLEIGHSQESAVLDVFSGSGLSHVDTRPDPAGIPRVVHFRKP